MSIKIEDRPYDVTGNIIAFEQGELEQEDVIILFQYLVDTGLAWQLQGCYRRMAVDLLNMGHISQR